MTLACFFPFQDEHLLRYIVMNDLMKPIIDAFISNGNRYNLLHSAVLELFEYIRKVRSLSLSLSLMHVRGCHFQERPNISVHKWPSLWCSLGKHDNHGRVGSLTTERAPMTYLCK